MRSRQDVVGSQQAGHSAQKIGYSRQQAGHSAQKIGYTRQQTGHNAQ